MSDDDELPPWLGQRFRDITFQLFRSAEEAVHDEEKAHPNPSIRAGVCAHRRGDTGNHAG